MYRNDEDALRDGDEQAYSWQARMRARLNRPLIKCACGDAVIDHRADGHCIWCGCVEVRVVQ